MKVLLVNGSPNRKGCTYVALKQIQDTLAEEDIDSKIYHVGHKDIRGCIDCRKCSELGKCIYDDEVNSFVEMAEEYDGYVFGGPVYYGTVNPTLTNFMTRVFFSSFFGGKRIFRLKPAAAVASARRAGTLTAIDTINRFLKMNMCLKDKIISFINVNPMQNVILNMFNIDKIFQIYMNKADAFEGKKPVINRKFRIV